MIEFITDRTQADVDRVNELARKGWANMTTADQEEWLAGMKGAYNYTDFNRIETATAELAVELGLELTTKTDWSAQDIPTQSDCERILNNISEIRAISARYSTTPSLPLFMINFNYEDANNVEKNLRDITKIEPSMFRSGEIFAGEM